MSFSSHHSQELSLQVREVHSGVDLLEHIENLYCRCVGRCTANATKKPPPHRDESCALPAVPPWCSTPTLSRGVALGSPGGAFASPGRPANGGRVRRRLLSAPRAGQPGCPGPAGVGFGSRLGSDIRRRASRPLSPRPQVRGAYSDSLCVRFAPTRLRLRLCTLVLDDAPMGRSPEQEDRAGRAGLSTDLTGKRP